jgi:hypothetical protein
MKTAAFCIAAALAFMLGSGPVSGGELPSVSSDTVAAPAAPPQLTKEQKLANVRVENFSWKKGRSEPVMIARYVIYNDNPFPIKDVEMTCVHMSDNGTVIDTDRRTVAQLGKKTCAAVAHMDMVGSINSQAKWATCVVTGFVSEE